jgi:hypothetical protein
MKKILLAMIFSEREQARLAYEKEKERLPLLVTESEEFARDAIKIIHAFADSAKECKQKSELQILRQKNGDQLMVTPISQTHLPVVEALNTTTSEEKKVAPIVSDTEEHFISSEVKEIQRKKRVARGISKRGHRDREMKVEEIQSPSFDITPRDHKKQRTEQEQDDAQLLLSFSSSCSFPQELEVEGVSQRFLSL